MLDAYLNILKLICHPVRRGLSAQEAHHKLIRIDVSSRISGGDGCLSIFFFVLCLLNYVRISKYTIEQDGYFLYDEGGLGKQSAQKFCTSEDTSNKSAGMRAGCEFK